MRHFFLPLRIIVLVVLLIANDPLRQASAYRVGDAVGILIRTPDGNHEAYRHQMPRFGVPTKAHFDALGLISGEIGDNGGADDSSKRNDRQPPERVRVSLQFDEGFQHLPWFEVWDARHGRALETLTVTFVYSGSDGSIHAVSRDTSYATERKERMPKTFTVEYAWVEEADVDLRGGALALFWGTALATLWMMIRVCTGGESGGKSRKSKGGGAGGSRGAYADQDVLYGGSMEDSSGFAKRC